MPRIGDITGPAGVGLGVALPLLTSLSNPVSAAVAGGVALIGLVDKIGQGRRTANNMTDPGAPQDIINKQLAEISNHPTATAQERAEATDLAWRQFLQAANDFAQQGPTHAKVARQAIFQTPGLTQTVQSLGGFDPLDAKYTQMAEGGISTGSSRPNEQGIGKTLGYTAGAVAAPFVTSRIQDKLSGKTTPVPGGGNIPEQKPGQLPIPGSPVDLIGAKSSAQGKSLLEQLLGFVIPGIGAGVDLYSMISGSKAAKEAAEIEAQSAKEAREQLERFHNQTRQDQLPNLQTGQISMATLSNLMGMPAAPDNPFNAQVPFQPQPISPEIRAVPVYGRSMGSVMGGR